ncbi:MAG: N-acetylgalactosamine-6-sulfatase [Verrucomicrobia bacterium TMED40]|nr:MAG: N-acetylgalactosamine-6-sulfatase [Verrucomicrobia bacterium TMED40]
MKYLSSLLLVFGSVCETPAQERPGKPNIVLILTDDLGWQDVKCYDIDEPSPMETPNIDALAKKGVKFWQAYAPAPTCAPSRCAIMSGNHPARAQKTHVVGGAPPTPNHKNGWSMMAPWYSGRMPENETTLARVLQSNGYVTGHSGKWHMAIDHKAFPQPEDQGFDWTRSSRGARSSMPSRVEGFASKVEKDPFRLDKNGYPFHQTSEDALTFLRQNHHQPFFLYYATWLVHTPIHTRSEQLLEKYCRKLGVEKPKDDRGWTMKGQTNPFYCAMVEELDYHMGKVFNYLNNTEDPRWPGHKLAENTYVIFTSDNGGMEGHPGEVITDNYPLDKGKISAMEGGTRVPLIITGPGIPKGVESQVMVNGLDFYPTLLTFTKTPKPMGKNLDGCDLSKLLTHEPNNSDLVRNKHGKPRNSMIWHFPHSVALESTIRSGGFKLIRNYDHKYNPHTPELELYQLYKDVNGKPVRVDIEEANNLVTTMPDKANLLNKLLSQGLSEMNASFPYYNPRAGRIGKEKQLIPSVSSHQRASNLVKFKFSENGAKVIRGDLIYTPNGGARYEEWYRIKGGNQNGNEISFDLPEGATHYFLNLIDENNFLVSYPQTPDYSELSKTKDKFAKYALSVE